MSTSSSQRSAGVARTYPCELDGRASAAAERLALEISSRTQRRAMTSAVQIGQAREA
jgi:hypothetical protein